jgi:hypothetical protein
MTPEYITLAEAAQHLHRSWHSTWSRMLRGEIEGVKVGRSWMVRRADVMRLVKAGPATNNRRATSAAA